MRAIKQTNTTNKSTNTRATSESKRERGDSLVLFALSNKDRNMEWE